MRGKKLARFLSIKLLCFKEIAELSELTWHKVLEIGEIEGCQFQKCQK